MSLHHLLYLPVCPHEKKSVHGSGLHKSMKWQQWKARTRVRKAKFQSYLQLTFFSISSGLLLHFTWCTHLLMKLLKQRLMFYFIPLLSSQLSNWALEWSSDLQSQRRPPLPISNIGIPQRNTTPKQISPLTLGNHHKYSSYQWNIT